VYPAESFADGVESFVSALAHADPEVVRQLVRLAACADTRGADENIRAAEEAFLELAKCAPARRH
jgi:hypothetical protein